MIRRARAAVVFAAVALTLEAPARAQPDSTVDNPVERFWSASEEAPKPLTASEEARATYERTTREAEEARLAQILGVVYLRGEGLIHARVRCTPLCGITRIRMGVGPGAPTVASLVTTLRAFKPIYVGASPALGLGDPPEKGLVTWFPRRVHPRFPCDCAVGVIGIGDGGAFFEALDGAKDLPDDVRYTRGEARDAALRQLVVLDPRSNGEPDEPVVVVRRGTVRASCTGSSFAWRGCPTRSTSTMPRSRS